MHPFKVLFLAISTLFTVHCFGKVEKPKLILVIAVDQFRADYLQKFSHLFLPANSGKKVGGFNYLMEKGAYFSHAEYGLLHNMTGPGHATILTGSYAYQNGIPNNDWFNPKTQEFVYCTEDQSQKTVGATPSNLHVGTSPKNLIGTTFGDELKNAYHQSKVVSIALKDRASILMGGHRADLALWFDAESFQWVSSEYYLSDKKLPEWLHPINKKLKDSLGKELVWEKKLDSELNPNPQVPETKYTKEMKVSFPHKSKMGGVATLLFPIAVDMPIDVAIKAIDELNLGKGPGTDVLAISFSNHDYVGHNFGPESDEIKETTVLEDKTISRLLNHVDLKNTWIVLTADHGVAGNPLVLQKNKIPAGHINQDAIAAEMENYLRKKYGKESEKWILPPSELNFYINQKLIQKHELNLLKVRDRLAKHIMKKKDLLVGITDVFSGTDVRRRTLPPMQHERQILRTYFEGRSGDVIMIPAPNYVLAYGAATHMSGYSYDRYVPVIFSGKPFKAGRYAGGEVVDIAPTLSFLMGIIPPTSSEGHILEKALNL
ncbi:MAG: alkaline phosphatase family protein [Bacteriovoracaceae bacterium]